MHYKMFRHQKAAKKATATIHDIYGVKSKGICSLYEMEMIAGT